MKTLSELLADKNYLPQGNIYKKNINGKTYFYHQYFSNGKRYSKIVDTKTALELKEKILERKQIEKSINSLRSKERVVNLSKSADSLTGTIMMGNREVAEFKNGDLIWVDDDYAPLIIVRTHSLENFLSLRTLDISRTNARILKKVLNITTNEEYKIPLFSYALSISDNYWFKPKQSKLKYNDIIFNNDNYFDASLKGDSTLIGDKTRHTPELTTTGSYEKGWKLINNEWWLYKSGNKNEYFSELFSSKFAKLIGLKTVDYEMDGDYIRTKNFAKTLNFEPMASIAGDNEEYNNVFNLLFKMNRRFAKEYLFITFFDAVTYNIDRHNENLGFLRSRKNGKILSLAPNFDNNLSLISTTNSLKYAKECGFVKVFLKFLRNNENALNLYKTISFKKIEKNEIKAIFNNIDIKVENTDDLVEKIYERYTFLSTFFNNKDI